MERFKRVDFEGFCFVLPGETFEEIEPSTEDEPKPRVCSDWVHSSDFGITRVSDGSRYNDITSPPFQDKTYQVPGRDGAYYFESFYNARQIQVQFAFDHMSETQLRALRKRFDGKNMGELIFDEYPFKAYTVKLQQPLQVKYVCFDEEIDAPKRLQSIYSSDAASDEVSRTFERVYKGEGTINFICYDPFARAVHPYLSQYDEFNYPNIGQWADASGLEAGPQEFTDKRLVLYNNGDYPAEYKIYIPFDFMDEQLKLEVFHGDESLYTLLIDSITKRLKTEDEFILIDMERHLIKGANFERIPTGSIYNSYISAGEFGNLPLSDGREIRIEITNNRSKGWAALAKTPTNRVLFQLDANIDRGKNYVGDAFGYGYGPFEQTSNEWVLQGGATLQVTQDNASFAPNQFFFDRKDYPTEANIDPSANTYFTFYKNKGSGSGTDFWVALYRAGQESSTSASKIAGPYPFLCDSQITVFENQMRGALASGVQDGETFVVYVGSTSSAPDSISISSWSRNAQKILSADVVSTFKLDYRYF